MQRVAQQGQRAGRAVPAKFRRATAGHVFTRNPLRHESDAPDADVLVGTVTGACGCSRQIASVASWPDPHDGQSQMASRSLPLTVIPSVSTMLGLACPRGDTTARAREGRREDVQQTKDTVTWVLLRAGGVRTPKLRMSKPQLPRQRWKHFSRNDHARIWTAFVGASSICSRLTAAHGRSQSMLRNSNEQAVRRLSLSRWTSVP